MMMVMMVVMMVMMVGCKIVMAAIASVAFIKADEMGFDLEDYSI